MLTQWSATSIIPAKNTRQSLQLDSKGFRKHGQGALDKVASPYRMRTCQKKHLPFGPHFKVSRSPM
jgi:hypothetical protein